MGEIDVTWNTTYDKHLVMHRKLHDIGIIGVKRLLVIIKRMNTIGEPFKEWAGLLVIQDRRLLVLKETDKPFFFLPGGKVEEGESNEETVARETEEELGLTVESLTLYTDLFEPSWSNGQIYRYRCFFGRIGPLPESGNMPGKTEAVAWVNSRSESEENIKLGTIPQGVLLELLNDGYVG